MGRQRYAWYWRMTRWAGIALVVFSLFPSAPAHALAEGDGRLIYGQNFTTSSPNKGYNDRTGIWGTAADLSTDASFAVRFAKAVGSPVSNELIEVHSNSNGQYRTHRWDGSSWTLDWTDSGGGSSSSAFVPRFDVAYNSNGDAVVFYSSNTTGSAEISYQTYTAATHTWSGELTYDAVRTTGTVKAIRVVNRPGTDEFAVAWNDANFDLSATYYDFSTGNFSAEPGAALTLTLSNLAGAADPRTRNFDIAIEQASGDVLACWSEQGVTDLKCNARSAGTGGTWGGTITYTSFTNEPQDMQLASDPDPTSNKIAIVGGDDLGLLNAAVWSGTAWGNFNALDATIDTLEVSTVNCAVEWIRSGSASRAVVTYDDADAAGIDWATYNPSSGTWTVQTDITTAFSPAASNDKWHELKRNPLDSDEIVSLVIDGNNDLSVKKLGFDGTSFSWSSLDDTGGTSHNDNQPTQGGWTATFVYYANVPTPALGTDIVDATGASVASPSLSMSAVNSSSTCQTSTGTLGTSGQKLRVSNTTTTPGWSLTAAATGGTTSNWSATTDSYDFNDSGGTGCADGADTDSLAGQLSIDPSTGTIAADPLCTTSNVSLGSSSAFVEGTTNNITLFSASSSANTNCDWDLTGVGLSQKIPPYRLPGTYSLQLTLTATAN